MLIYKKKKKDLVLYLDLVKELKRLEVNCDTDCSWCIWNGPQEFGKKIEGIENPRKNRVYTDHSIIEIVYNTRWVQETLRDFLLLGPQWKTLS